MAQKTIETVVYILTLKSISVSKKKLNFVLVCRKIEKVSEPNKTIYICFEIQKYLPKPSMTVKGCELCFNTFILVSDLQLFAQHVCILSNLVYIIFYHKKLG